MTVILQFFQVIELRFLDPTSIAAFVAVAPATSNAYGPSTYEKILTKTLFIYGSKDKNLGKRGR